MATTRSDDPETLAASVGFAIPERYNVSRILWDNLPDRADEPAIIEGGRSISYRELAAEAARIGAHLLSLGCAPGERVLMMMDDEPAYPAAIMGAARAGLVPVLANVLSTPDTVRFFLEDSGANVAIVSASFVDLFDEAVRASETNVQRLNAADRPWSTATASLSEHPTGRRDPAFWMYSSGSTGRPKGVVHKHEDAAYVAHTYARSILNIGPRDICFSIPKIFFAYGFGNSVIFPMSVGAAAVLLPGRPTPSRCFEAVRMGRPTILFGLPTLYTALMSDPSLETADLISVRLCVSAAEVLSSELAQEWRSRFGHAIVEGLGSTEMLHIYLSNDEKTQKPGSAGRAVPGYAIRLVDEYGADVPDGQEGVMRVMGLSGAEYYWNRPEKTAETMRDGWVDTGDRFVRDADGFYFFRGRKDDLVKISGQWVFPLEIEWTLNEHPSVLESCVQAVELADGRSTLKAWIALVGARAGGDELAEELRAYAKSRLLPHKYPRQITFVDRLPKTGTDKIDRQALLLMGAAE